jgi:predicted DNA-binding transcriptional regulator AlpA
MDQQAEVVKRPRGRPVKSIAAQPSSMPRYGLVTMDQFLAPAGPVPMSAPWCWKAAREGDFPKPTCKIGSRTVWDAAGIWSWLQAKGATLPPTEVAQ